MIDERCQVITFSKIIHQKHDLNWKTALLRIQRRGWSE